MTARQNVGSRLSPAAVADVDRLAEAEDRTRSDMIRVLIVEAINNRKSTVMSSTMCACGDMQPTAHPGSGNLFVRHVNARTGEQCVGLPVGRQP